jgi:hypothetical protein
MRDVKALKLASVRPAALGFVRLRNAAHNFDRFKTNFLFYGCRLFEKGATEGLLLPFQPDKPTSRIGEITGVKKT